MSLFLYVISAVGECFVMAFGVWNPLGNLMNKLNQSGLLGVINVSNKKIPGLVLSHKCGLACKPVVPGVC